MFNREKFKALVHYVIAQAGSRSDFGATKLNKVLWFADARQYMLTRKSITGATYTRQEFGPVPKPIMPVRDELSTEGKIKIFAPKFKYEGWRFKSLQQPSVLLFSREELQNINWWIRYVADEHTADSISEESHDYAWEIAKTGESLPFFAFFSSRIREPDPEEMDWAREAARRLGRA